MTQRSLNAIFEVAHIIATGIVTRRGQAIHQNNATRILSLSLSLDLQEDMGG